MTSVPFDIPISDDSVLEGNENFILTIDPFSLPTGVTVGDPGQATVIIVDDDGNFIKYHCHEFHSFLMANPNGCMYS